MNEDEETHIDSYYAELLRQNPSFDPEAVERVKELRKNGGIHDWIGPYYDLIHTIPDEDTIIGKPDVTLCQYRALSRQEKHYVAIYQNYHRFVKEEFGLDKNVTIPSRVYFDLLEQLQQHMVKRPWIYPGMEFFSLAHYQTSNEVTIPESMYYELLEEIAHHKQRAYVYKS